MAALCYMQYVAALVPLIHLAAFAAILALRIDVGPDRRTLGHSDVLWFAVGGLTALVLFAPWLPHTMRIALHPDLYHTPLNAQAGSPPYIDLHMVYQIIARWGCGDGTGFWLYTTPALIGLASLMRLNKPLAVLLAGFFIVPFAYLALTPFANAVHPRYLIFVFPAYLLLAAQGILSCGDILHSAMLPSIGAARATLIRRIWIAAMIAALLAVNVAAPAPYYRQGIKCDQQVHPEFCGRYVDTAIQ